MRPLKFMAIGLASIFVPAAATAQTKLNPGPGNWSPPGIAAIFPETIGDYQRAGVTEIGPRWHSVTYVLRREGKRANTVSVFLRYADALNCKEEFDSSRSVLATSDPSVTLRKLGAAASPGGKEGAASHASYSLTTKYGTETAVPVTSDVYVYCKPGSRWIIKVRSAWPASQDLSRDTAMLLRAITWPKEVAD
ncbi:hypothetical protein [Sphingomonas soli]|uniref:hypothetical protein n=1 Tax=Sphingomonas soli TaxID=266127 RepID=UPI00082C1F33|nr:hypothetical protein [Sphingomonas soli]